MDLIKEIIGFIDQPNTYFCMSLAVLIIFSFGGTTNYLRYSLTGISAFYALIAVGLSLDAHEHRGFQYIAPDYYAAAFFAAFSAFGFLLAALFKQRKGLLRAIVILNCTTMKSRSKISSLATPIRNLNSKMPSNQISRCASSISCLRLVLVSAP